MAAVEEVLNSVKIAEESLKKMKKGRTLSGEPTVSDEDRIRLQFELDVKQFESLLDQTRH